jgi:transposase
MPIYFRYCPGNIVDVNTLCTTLAELKQYNIDADYAIVDAGYFCETNVKAMYRHGVKFVTRLAPNRKIFKEAYNEVCHNLTSSENALRYGNRLVYIAKTKFNIFGYTSFTYVGIDVDSRNQQTKRAAFEAFDDKLTNTEMDAKMARLGLFVIVSSEHLPKSEILPLYYTRQQVEQVFDISKNNADILPIRVQNEDTFRGHLMLTFLATVIIQKLQRDIITKRKKSDKVCPEGAFMNLRNQKCKVFQREIVPQEAVRTNNELYKMFDIICPTSILKCSKN